MYPSERAKAGKRERASTGVGIGFAMDEIAARPERVPPAVFMFLHGDF
ncbi:MAG: hypothetical protein PHV05_03480 [Candidatus Riflebacteria bacterium]|nr:hypothetical protein [Candidatus Riflebacteria bacterium]